MITHILYGIVQFCSFIPGNDQGQLDFFLVNRLKDTSSKDLCSQYPGFANAVEPGRGMRVNCYSRRQFHSKVRIDSSKNEGLHISEVAVHSLGELSFESCSFG